MQHREGRYFAYEHPKTATSWKMAEVVKVANMDRVQVVKLDMCRFGMMSSDGDGPGLVLKPTCIMTNCPEIAKRVDRRCCNRDLEDKTTGHRHVALINGRASQAQVF